MKRVRRLGIRNQKITDRKAIQNKDSDEPMSRESVRKRPVTIDGKGYTAYVKKFKYTEDGVESEVEKPVFIDGRGYKVEEKDIKGICSICRKYVSKIFTCFRHGCKRLLCEEHVYFFRESDVEVPLCPEHYKESVQELNTWEFRKKRPDKDMKNEN